MLPLMPLLMLPFMLLLVSPPALLLVLMGGSIGGGPSWNMQHPNSSIVGPKRIELAKDGRSSARRAALALRLLYLLPNALRRLPSGRLLVGALVLCSERLGLFDLRMQLRQQLRQILNSVWGCVLRRIIIMLKRQRAHSRFRAEVGWLLRRRRRRRRRRWRLHVLWLLWL